MQSRNMLGTVTLVVSVMFASTAHAERYVVVNKQRLSNAEILELERRNCGPVVNGHYWYDANSGIWGYAGDPYPRGRLGDSCHRQQRRPSLSERGQLFSTWDWVRD